MLRDNQNTSTSDQRQQNNKVSIDPVKQDSFVPDHWHELKAHQKASRQDAKEVQHHADFEFSLKVEVAFSWRSAAGAVYFRIAENAVERKVFEAS